MTRTLDVISVDGLRDRRRFAALPSSLYRTDPNWVAPLRTEFRRQLDPARNPFFAHAEASLFLAVERGDVLGRISAHIDHRYNEFHGAKTGFWGFFESVDDPDVSDALLAEAAGWLADRGMDEMVGPASFTLNDEAGLLVDGFDSPPMILMSYNPPYYETLIEKAGLEPVQDLFAYRLEAASEAPAEVQQWASSAEKRFTFRKIRMSQFDAEMERFLTIYNDAWERNWGFVPLTEEELRDHAKRLRPVIDPELVILAEEGDEPIALALTLPNVNEVLIKARGSLGLMSAARLLWTVRMKKWQTCRVFTLGVRKGYRRTGVGAHLYLDTLEAAKRNGYRWGEMSWILGSNEEMNRGIAHMGGRRYKTYRMYRRDLRP